MALSETARLIASLELKDLFSGTASKIERSMGGLEKSMSRAERAGRQVGVGIRNTGILVAAGATAIAGGFVGALKVASDFEDQLNTINTIAHKNATDLKGIGAAIRKVATDTGTPLKDLTQGYYDLLSAGVKAADATNVLTQANKLAIGGLATTTESINLLTGAINTYGGDATKAASYTDIFAKAIERGKVTAAELSESFSKVGNLAASNKIEINEVAAAFARLTSVNIPAGEAATFMASSLIALTRTTPALEKLQKQTGRNYLSIAGNKGLVVALEQLRKDAAKTGQPLIDLVGRQEALQFILATTGPNFAKYNEDLAAMGNAAGTAASQMSERQQGLNFQLTRLKALGKDALISLASPALARVAAVFERINKSIADPKVQAQIGKIGDQIAAAFSDKNIAAAGKAFGELLDTAKSVGPILLDVARTAAGFMKVAVDAFRSLPPDIQKLAIGALAVNKLTGGLVTNVATGIVGAILGNLKSAVVNVTGAVVNVGGVPGVGGGGGLPPVVQTGEKAAGGFLGALKTGLKFLPWVGVGALIFDGFLTANKEHPELFGAQGTSSAGSAGPGTPTQGRLARPGVAAVNVVVSPQSKAAISKAVTDALTAGLTAGGRVIGGLAGNATRTKDDRVDLVNLQRGANALLSDGFRRMVEAIKSAKTAEQIRAAIKTAVATVVTQGRGNVQSTIKTISALKEQLKNTHDPKLRAELSSAIRKVEAKLPARQFAAQSFSALQGMLRDGKLSKSELTRIKGIEQALKDRGLPHAAEVISQKVKEAQRAQVAASKAAGQQAAFAIRDKDLSVVLQQTINPAPIHVSVSALYQSTRTYAAYGNRYTNEIRRIG